LSNIVVTIAMLPPTEVACTSMCGVVQEQSRAGASAVVGLVS
jgi:hypothetical protein